MTTGIVTTVVVTTVIDVDRDQLLEVKLCRCLRGFYDEYR
jgi:hypothetical protein